MRSQCLMVLVQWMRFDKRAILKLCEERVWTLQIDSRDAL